MNRRKFIHLAISGTGALATGGIAVSAAIHAISPALEPVSTEPLWKSLGPASGFPPGEVTAARVRISDDPSLRTVSERSVYVWHRTEGNFVVFSRACTDLGCPVTRDPGNGWYYCPCHGGIFDEEGERRAGPPKRPLWRYSVRLVDGALEIDLRSVPALA